MLCALLTGAAMAAEHGTVIRKAAIYVAPDVSSAKLATAEADARPWCWNALPAGTTSSRP